MLHYIQISDPQHGWLKVPRADYDASGFKASRFSYQSSDNKYVYLEEDCDLFGFLKASGLLTLDNNLDATKVTIKYKYVNRTSIRNMERIR